MPRFSPRTARRPLKLLTYRPHPQMYHNSQIATYKKAGLLIDEFPAFITQDYQFRLLMIPYFLFFQIPTI